MERRKSVVRAHASAAVVGLREGLRAYRDHAILTRSDRAFTAALSQAMNIPGFTSPIELSFLYHLGRADTDSGRVVEIGSYLGRSTVVLAHAVQAAGNQPVAAVDPHAGDLTIEVAEPNDTVDAFRANMKAAGIDSHVSLFHTTSAEAAASWSGDPIGLLFIDGLHTRDAVLEDVGAWSPWLAANSCVVLDDYLIYPEVRAAVRELRCEGSLRGRAVVVGKMIAFGPRARVSSVATPIGARLLAAMSDRAIDRFNWFFRDRRLPT